MGELSNSKNIDRTKAGKQEMEHKSTGTHKPDFREFFRNGTAWEMWRNGNPYEFVQTYEVMKQAFGYERQYVNFGYWPEGPQTVEAGREMSLLVGDVLGLSRGDRLLEGGSGLGQAAVDLCEHYDLDRALGMNPCIPQVEYANQLAHFYGLSGRIQHEVCDASQRVFEIEPGTFTHGMAMECIGVFPDPEAFLRGMYQQLPSGGRMAFTVVTSPGVAPTLQDWSGKLFFGVGTLPGQRWVQRLEAAGFVEVKRRDITAEVLTPMLDVVRQRIESQPEILHRIGPLLRLAVLFIMGASERGLAKGKLGYELVWGTRP